MRPTTILTVFACLSAAACSRTSDTTGTTSTTTNPAPGANANPINNNPSGATPMNSDPSGVAPLQPSSADGVEFAGGTKEGGVAVGGGPAGGAHAADNAAAAAGDKAKAGGSADTKGGVDTKAKAGASDQGDSCPGATDVRVAGNPGFCAKACRSDIDCAPSGKCNGTGRTSAKGYSQPNGKYCVDSK
jgi:hypothetical protein